MLKRNVLLYLFFTISLISKDESNIMNINEKIEMIKNHQIDGNIKMETLKELIAYFKRELKEEEYEIIVYQREMLESFKNLLIQIDNLEIINFERETSLLFANAFFKGANIHRRLADEESLNLALRYHQKVLEIRRKFLDKNDLQIGESLCSIGATFNELKGKENNLKAIEKYKEAIQIFEENNEKGEFLLACASFTLANALRDFDDCNIDLSIGYLQKALNIFNKISQSDKVKQEKGKALYNLGVNYHRINNFDKAIIYLTEAKNIFESLNDKTRYSITLTMLAEVYRCKKEFKLALDCLNESLDLQAKVFLNDHHEIGNTLYNLGLVYIDLSEYKTAHGYLQKALDIQQKVLRPDHQDIEKIIKKLKSINCEYFLLP